MKHWDIRINYGIKTGFNEAFIINGAIREKLIAQDPKSDEIIRPILRGRDIKRYGYNFDDKYLIATFPSMNYNIDNYPSVKRFLEGFKPKLNQSGEALTDKEIEQILAHGTANGIFVKETDLKVSRKKTNNHWFETQDSISYWDDFSKQKIVWGEISDKSNFALDSNDNYFVNNKCYVLSGSQLEYLVCFLNSPLAEYLFSKIATTTGVGTLQWSKFTIETLSVPVVNEQQLIEFQQFLSPSMKGQIDKEKINARIYEICHLSLEEIDFIESR